MSEAASPPSPPPFPSFLVDFKLGRILTNYFQGWQSLESDFQARGPLPWNTSETPAVMKGYEGFEVICDGYQHTQGSGLASHPPVSASQNTARNILHEKPSELHAFLTS